MSFDHLKVSKPIERTEDYHFRKPNVENLLFEIGEKKHFCGRKIITLETNDIIVKFSSELGLNGIQFSNAFGEENIYFILLQKFIPTQEHETSTLKHEYEYSFKRDAELKGDSVTDETEGIIELNNFINCKIISDENSN